MRALRRRPRGLAAAAATAAAVALAATAATAPTAASAATFSAPQLVSGAPALLVDQATDPALSADGRFVAFTGSLAGVQGIYRKDVASGELTLVAAGDATAPSISADGRYVSFTTTRRLLPSDGAGPCGSVYVRDMTLPRGTPGAETLASALDGSATGLSYGDGFTATCTGGGSSAAARAALSADGRHVAFTIIGRSNLETGPGGAVTTPPGQVVVRDLDTQRTTLVSQTSASLGGTPQPVPGGAALASVAGAGSSTAAISADGGTVAWMGIDIPAQAPVAAGSAATATALPVQYDEPLWRRIADGPSAPTRRVTGGDDPACGCDGPLATGYDPQTTFDGDAFPDHGTYVLGAVPTVLDALAPQLSGDGRVVAFLSTQPSPAAVSALTFAGVSSIPPANAYVADMTPGLTRAQALRPLTAWAGFDFTKSAATGRVRDVAISPDGAHVAFTTDRILFSLAQPALVSQPLNQPGAAQLYDVDLTHGTFSRVSDGFDAQPADGDVSAPAFSGDGKTIAFASSAANLVYGVGAQSTSIFAIADVTTPPVAGAQSVSAAPANPAIAPRWRIGASARRGPHGTVLLDVSVPGKGTLKASASASVPVTTRAKVRVRVRLPSGRHRTVTRWRTSTRLARRTLTTGRATPRKAGVVRIVLTPARVWNPLVASRQGLVATVAIGFTATRRARLAQTLQVSFHGTPAKPRPKAKGTPKSATTPKKPTKGTS